LQEGSAEPPRANHQHTSVLQPLLTWTANVAQDYVSSVSLKFFRGKRHGGNLSASIAEATSFNDPIAGLRWKPSQL
jgi:hypothetical protein